MTSKTSTNSRVDNQFKKDIEDTARIRYERKLAKFNPKELGMAEMTRLLRRTPSWQKALEELRTLPKKENINMRNP